MSIYPFFLARGKQSAVAVVPIGPHCLEGQPGCYLSFRFYIPSKLNGMCLHYHKLPHRDSQGTTWSLAFDSEETKVFALEAIKGQTPFLGRFCTRISGKPRSCRAWSACLHPRQGRGARPRARRPGRWEKNLFIG